ncbi:PucR family transcriptional regulator [Actinomadura fibrosa]|uniref:PucR family transcriptional regulator n=1 Tax=Actinomadura fibrosa TaxID=111802 RepID=A0ABW2XMP1_9ACTN|nr:helix-turn-helix domain-containing protein [Actinomadura fibrosa]
MPAHAPPQRHAPTVLPDRAPAATAIADIVRAGLPVLVDELIEEMRAHVPKADALFRLDAGSQARRGIEEMVRRFVDRVAAGAPVLDDDAERYGSFIRDAFLNGCDLNTLLALSQIGARVAWRHFAAAGNRAGFTPDEVSVLAERTFACMELVSAQAVDLFERLYEDAAATLGENRKRLLGALLSELGFSPRPVADLAREARWRLPGSVACVAVDDVFTAGGRLSPALDADVLTDLERPDPCLLVPAPDAAGRYEMLRRGLNGVAYAIGPVVPLEEAALSLRLARRGLALMLRGVLPGAEGHVRCDEHLPSLTMLGDEECLRILVRRALAAFSDCPPERRTRLSETLLTWLDSGSALREVAARLNIHPQTARYRMRQLEDRFGERLHDPDWRFEMQIALRFRALGRPEPALAGAEQPPEPARTAR